MVKCIAGHFKETCSRVWLKKAMHQCDVWYSHGPPSRVVPKPEVICQTSCTHPCGQLDAGMVIEGLVGLVSWTSQPGWWLFCLSHTIAKEEIYRCTKMDDGIFIHLKDFWPLPISLPLNDPLMDLKHEACCSRGLWLWEWASYRRKRPQNC